MIVLVEKAAWDRRDSDETCTFVASLRALDSCERQLSLHVRFFTTQ